MVKIPKCKQCRKMPAAPTDDFCSARCARVYHGVPIMGDILTPAQEARNALLKPRRPPSRNA